MKQILVFTLISFFYLQLMAEDSGINYEKSMLVFSQKVGHRPEEVGVALSPEEPYLGMRIISQCMRKLDEVSTRLNKEASVQEKAETISQYRTNPESIGAMFGFTYDSDPTKEYPLRNSSLIIYSTAINPKWQALTISMRGFSCEEEDIESTLRQAINAEYRVALEELRNRATGQENIQGFLKAHSADDEVSVQPHRASGR